MAGHKCLIKPFYRYRMTESWLPATEADSVIQETRPGKSLMESRSRLIKVVESDSFLLYQLEKATVIYVSVLSSSLGDVFPVGVHEREVTLPRSLRSLAVLSILVFWTERSEVVPGICGSHLPNLGVTALSALLIAGTTLAFTSHLLSSSFSFRPWFLSNFSYS